MAVKFDDLNTIQLGTPANGVNFDNLENVPQKKQGINFDNLEPSLPARDGILSRSFSALGGAFGALGRILSAPQQFTTGLAEKGLEETGVLKPTEITPVKAVQEQRSYIDVLQRIGKERGGGLLTGQYEPSTYWAGNFVRELPVHIFGTLADIFADPLWLASSYGQVAKATKATGEGITAGAKALAEEIPAVQKVGDMLGKAFITRFKQRSEFQAIDIQRKIDELMLKEDVGKLVAPIIEKPQYIQKRIAQIIQGGITTNEDLKILAEPIRQEFDRVGEAISKLNPKLLSEETFEANKGTYFPRLYTNYELPTEEETLNQFFKQRVVSIPRERFMGRLEDFEMAKTINPDIVDTENKIINITQKTAQLVKENRKEIPKLQAAITDLELKKVSIETEKTFSNAVNLFEESGRITPITEPEVKNMLESIVLYPDEELAKVGKAIDKNDVKLNKLFENIQTIKKEADLKIEKLPSVNEIKKLAEEARAKLGQIKEAGYPALKGLTQLSAVEVRQKFFNEISKIASEEARPGWIQMSEDKALGDLAGKFLPTEEYAAISSIRRIPSSMEKTYGEALTMWKTFKTAYNPATLSRNDLTNFFILNPLGGVGPHRVDIYGRVLNEIITKGPLYQLARKEGLEISTQQAAELENKATRFYKENESLIKSYWNNLKDFNQFVKNFYGSQDKFFKMANFIKGVTEDGLTPTQAMRRANFYLVDYSEVPLVVEWLRKSPVGIPFISFTYGVSKPLAKTLLERPDRLAAFYKILSGIQHMNPQGETPQDLQKEKDTLPDWISTGTFMRLPVKDEYKRGQYINLQYILPFNVVESKSLIPSSPVWGTLASLFLNVNTFTGKEITKPTDTASEKVQKQVTQVLSQLLPSATPFVGYSYKKVIDMIKNRPDSNGFVRDKLQVFIDIIGGVKITPIDPTVEAQKRMREKKKELEDLKSELFRISVDKTIFPEEKAQQKETILDKIKKVFK